MESTFPTIATICSHSALQIFHGARKAGLETLGICTPKRKELYNSFPQASPDRFLMVDDFKDILSEKAQRRLEERNAIVIPHGSFVEYVGAEEMKRSFSVPVYGNKDTLDWESDRSKEREWLRRSEIRSPAQYDDPTEIDGLSIVKLGGAKGGEGFFLVDSPEEYKEKIEGVEKEEITIQEYVNGTRYYPHYFYSLLEDRLEILGIDRRDESTIDEYYRAGRGEKSFVVVGNKPLAVRESLLPELYRMGKNLVKTSQDLFPPGLHGPFCLETICTPELEFVTFEVSARIVAGTNLYTEGSPYSFYYYDEPMSTGKRLSLEIKNAARENELEKIVS